MNMNVGRRNFQNSQPRHFTEPLQAPQFAEDLFWYQISFGNMAAGAVVQTSITVQSDSDFEWYKSAVYGSINGGTPPFLDSQITEVNLLITDGGSSRNLMLGAVPLNSLGGSGKLPYINSVPRIFMAKSTIVFVATNFSAASTYNNISLSMGGKKIFRKGP